MSSCLLAGQFLSLLIWCFRSPRCALVLVQWNRKWSTVWSPLLQIHFASSRRLKLWRYALVFPCPDSTAAIFGVKLIFIPSLSRTDGKYCFVALWYVVHSACHFCMASSAASCHKVLLGILLKSYVVPSLRAASLAICRPARCRIFLRGPWPKRTLFSIRISPV
jgi:hypothetical protein